MKAIRRIAALMMLFLPAAVVAQDATPIVEILSKDDTRAMFAMTKNQ